MNKEYFNIPEGESQYADIDLTKTSMVKARYIHAAEETDAGNIFIEALPPYRSPEECESDYFKPMPGYDAEKACSLSDYRKHIQIDRLQEVRFPLPYQDTLEAGFYLMLLRSYRARTMTTYFNHEQSVTVADRVNLINAHVNGNANSHAIVGMALIGISGCGKSSTLSILTSRYPQVIFHETPDFLRTTQIVHLTVQCPQNSNFSTLYLNIGIAIDKALGNSEPVYANEISKERTLGSKAAAVCRLINKFSIGCIILDEIQCIDFGSLSEKSYDAITTIVNETNVGILSVGTEEAADTMFSKLRQMRRIGRCINGCDYIDNHEYFRQIIDSLWEYQWFDKPVAITDEIAETLYQCSYGVVYLLTQIYISMWDAYLEAPANRKPEFTPEFIRKIADKFYQKHQEKVDKILNEWRMHNLTDMDNPSGQSAEQSFGPKRRAKTTESLTTHMAGQELQRKYSLQEAVCSNVSVAADAVGESYTDPEIKAAVRHVCMMTENIGRTEKELTRLAMSELRKNAADPARRSGCSVVDLTSILPPEKDDTRV